MAIVLGYAGLCVGLHVLAKKVEDRYSHLIKSEEHGVANRIVSTAHASLLGLIALRQMLANSLFFFVWLVVSSLSRNN